MTQANALWLATYLAFIGTIAGGMFYARGAVFAEYDTPEARAEWEKWREKARTDSAKWAKEHGKEHEAPVDRRVPKSAEPPALVLMRDYFGICLFGAVFFSSLLFATLAIAIRGALSSEDPEAERGEKPTSPT